MVFGLGAPELVVIVLVALVVFGPKNLPKLGSALGKTVRNVREGMSGELDEPERPSPSAEACEPVYETADDKAALSE